jgi:hypothetical protein
MAGRAWRNKVDQFIMVRKERERERERENTLQRHATSDLLPPNRSHLPQFHLIFYSIHSIDGLIH